MKVALLCFLLFAVCFAQFDQEPNVGDALSLTSSISEGRHSERDDRVDDQVLVRNRCQDNVHRVSSVSTSNGAENSGTYFTVLVENTSDDGDVNVTFGEPTDDDDDTPQNLFEIIDSDGGSSVGAVGVCLSGNDCTFIYKCELYPSSSNLEVTVSSDAGSDDNDIGITYNLEVTQYIEDVTTIDRSFRQNSAVSVPFSSSVIGPQNYAQYYHEFEGTAAEYGSNSVFYIIVSDFDAGVTGDAIVCVSFDSIVSNTQDMFDDNDEDFPSPDDFPGPIAEENCDSFCQRSEIDNEGDLVYLAFSPCEDLPCELDRMWIGVRPPTESRFTITLRPETNSLPQTITIGDSPFSAEGEVSDTCDVGNFDYSCEDYYVIDADTDFPSPADDRLGPFLSVNIYGPLGGDVNLEISSNSLGGENSCPGCGASLFTCPASITGDVDEDVSCHFNLQPCEYNPEVAYTATVTGENADDSDVPIEYGIDISLDSYPVEEVNPISTVYGNVAPGRQNHYTVTFEDDEINADSYFEVELYVRNSNGDNLALAWNFNAPAGDGICYDNLGVCRTNLDCDDFGFAPYALSSTAVPSCRFVYQDCDANVAENFARNLGPVDDFTNGLRVAELQAGTFWFNVYRIDDSSSSNTDATVEYTLKFNLRRSIPVFDNLVTLGSVHFAETSPQYVYNIPNTPSIRDFVVTVDNVRNGGVTVYVECGSRAGECPCGTFTDSCDAAEGTDSGRCQITIPRCSCVEEALHIAVTGSALPGFSSNQPIYFALAVDAFDAELDVLPLPATRAGTTASSHLSEIYYQTPLSRRNDLDFEIGLYELTFDNVDLQDNDSLFVTVNVLTELDFEPSVDEEGVFMSVGPYPIYDFASSVGACGQAFCVAGSNNGNAIGAEGYFSTCTIDLRQCASGCDDRQLFDPSQRYIVSVFAPTSLDLVETRVLYSVTAQVVGSFAVPLQDSIPMRAESVNLQYNHFAFDIGSVPANSRLVLDAYSDAGSFPLEFYANYYNGIGAPELAGSEEDCYGNIFCEVCVMSVDNNNHCVYEVPPCILSQQTGTYYLSVRAPRISSASYNGYSTNSIAPPRNIDFTVEARVIEIIDVLEAERVLVGSLSAQESAYYRVNVPSGDLDILRIEFEATSTDVVVGISTVMPDQQCAACSNFLATVKGTTLRSVSYPCDLPEDTLYISVTVDPAIVTDDCTRFDFIVHAHEDAAIQRTISLSADTTSDFITRSYDSTSNNDDDDEQLVLRNREFIVYEFNVNAADGEFLVIEATQNTTDSETYTMFLSAGSPYFPSAGSDDLMIADPAADCGVLIDSCTEEEDTCRLILMPCQLDDETYYLTFSGEDVALDGQTDEIALVIRQFVAEELPNIPDDTDASVDNMADGDAVFENIGMRSFVTQSIGLDGGQKLTFDGAVNVDAMHVSRGEEASPTGCPLICGDAGDTECNLYACEDVNSARFYIFVLTNDDDGDVTITINLDQGNTVSDLNDSDIDENDPQTFDGLTGNSGDFDAEFRYHTISVDDSDIDRFELIIDDGDVFFVPDGARRVYLPGFDTTGDSDAFVVFRDGTTSDSCGLQEISPLPSGRCCFESQDYTFVVVGGDNDYTITFDTEEFSDSPRNINLPEEINEDFPADSREFDQFSFDLDTDEALYFTFEVLSGEASLFLNQGDNAGRNTQDDSDFASCFGNDGFVGDSVCAGERNNGDDPCAVFVSPCDSRGCPAFGSQTTRYTFAVVPSDSATEYQLNVTAVDYVENLGNNNDDLDFPSFEATSAASVESDGFDAKSVFRYEVPGDIRSEDFIPRQTRLSLDDAIFPRITFNITNFRDSDGVSINNPFDIFQGDSQCTLGSLGALCDDLDEQNEFTLCSVEVCSLACGQEIYFTFESDDDGPYEFDFDVIERFNYFDDDEDPLFVTDELSVSGSSGTSSANLGNSTLAAFITTSFPGVGSGEYAVMTLSVEGETGDTFSLESYENTCSSAGATIDGCDNLVSGESCTIVFDPCTSSALSLGNFRFFFELFKEDDNDSAWSYELDIEVRTIDPIDSAQTALSPTGQTTYAATKGITDNTWQFYDFVVSPNDGYSTLSVTVDSLLCQSDAGDDLDIYFSWGTDGEYRESARPNRFPTLDCHVEEFASASDATSDLMDTCEFRGGSYRVGIFAGPATQLFTDDDDDSDDDDSDDDDDPLGTDPENVILPAVYNIAATLTTLPRIQATLGCSLVQTSNSSFIERIEIPVEATNRGAKLIFGIESDDDDANTITLSVARGGYSFGNDVECEFDSTTTFVGTCDTDGPLCIIEIDPCTYADGLWFAYISGVNMDVDDEDASVTLLSYIDYPYIPVYDMTVTDSVSVSASLPRFNQFQPQGVAGDVFYQYYKLIISGAVEISIDADDCLGCSFDVNYFFGEQGHGFNSVDAQNGCDAASGCDCGCTADRTCTVSPGNVCSDIVSSCSTDDVIFIGIGNANSDSCGYQMEAIKFAPVAADATVLIPDQVSCDITGCNRLFELTTPGQDITDLSLTVTVVNDLSDSVDVIIGSDFNCVIAEIVASGTSGTFSFDGCTPLDGPLFVFVVAQNCFDCLSEQNALLVSFTINEVLVSDLEIDEPLEIAAGQARLDISAGDFVFVNGAAVEYVQSSAAVNDFAAAACGTACSRVINGGDSGTSVIFDSPPAGFLVSSVDVETLRTSSEFEIDLISGGFVHLSYDIPAGVTSITVNMDNVAYGTNDATDLDDIAVRFVSSFTNVPFLDDYAGAPADCSGACGDLSELTASACDRSFEPVVIDVCGFNRIFFSVGVCENLVCPLSFDIRVETAEDSAELVTGGDHTDSYETVEVPAGTLPTCNSGANEVENLNFAVEVTSILYVSVREPMSSPDSPAGVTATYSLCGAGVTCTASQDVVGVDSSCAIGEPECNNDYCVPAGTYNVEFTAPVGPASFEYQIITEWVELSTRAQDTVIGEAAHFYRISNANQALSIALTITTGPAVEFTVMEGCSDISAFSFKERQICSFGVCHVWLPTRAKNPGQSDLYVVIDSGRLLETGPLDNTEYEKETEYEIEVVRGTANCGNRPTSGYCADALAGASNNQVWQYTNMLAKQDEAECLFNSLAGGCPSPSGVCRDYLKTLACLTVFPQCDASGYQMGVCNDICLQIEDACGVFTDFRAAYQCNSGRYAPASNGTCVGNLPINGIPNTPSLPAQKLNAEAAVDVLPAQLIVPVFPPLYATLPTLILDDDEDAKMLVQKMENTDSSSASLATISCTLFAVILLAF